jgi:GNAT superfamily N-acetyltransferase
MESETPTVQYRPLREAELGEAADVFLTALFDLAGRNGLATPAFTRASVDPVYRHIFETGTFEVADVGGRIGGICCAIVRDHLWFLSGFWLLPELQRKKVGGPLLERVWQEGQRRGASTAFTWASIDLTAMATYMKLGMLPGYPVLTFAGAVTSPSAELDGYEVEPLTMSVVMAIDGEIRATRRESDHGFWLGGQAEGRQVVSRGRPVGYYYLSHGVIGPAAWSSPDDAEALIGLALRDAARASGTVRLMIPGINHTAIRRALAAGLRLAGFSHLLTTAPFGRMDQYLPSGPSLF